MSTAHAVRFADQPIAIGQYPGNREAHQGGRSTAELGRQRVDSWRRHTGNKTLKSRGLSIRAKYGFLSGPATHSPRTAGRRTSSRRRCRQRASGSLARNRLPFPCDWFRFGARASAGRIPGSCGRAQRAARPSFPWPVIRVAEHRPAFSDRRSVSAIRSSEVRRGLPRSARRTARHPNSGPREIGPYWLIGSGAENFPSLAGLHSGNRVDHLVSDCNSGNRLRGAAGQTITIVHDS